jgi:hypothetical protein
MLSYVSTERSGHHHSPRPRSRSLAYPQRRHKSTSASMPRTALLFSSAIRKFGAYWMVGPSRVLGGVRMTRECLCAIVNRQSQKIYRRYERVKHMLGLLVRIILSTSSTSRCNERRRARVSIFAFRAQWLKSSFRKGSPTSKTVSSICR